MIRPCYVPLANAWIYFFVFHRGLNLRVYDLKGKNYCMIFHNFVDHIVPSESTVKVCNVMHCDI